MMFPWWYRLSDDIDQVMIQIQWWWSRSSDDDPDPMMIQMQDEDDLKMNMTWRQTWIDDDPDDTEKKTCIDKLCRENTFLVKRESWCKCKFRMYSFGYLMYYTPMFIMGCVCNVIESCHTPMFILGSFYNVNKSCQVIVGNPPIDQGLKSPQLRGARVVRLT